MTAAKKLERALRDNYFRNATYAETSFDGVQMLVSGDRETQVSPRIHFLVTESGVTDGFEGTNAGEFTATLVIALAYMPDETDGAKVDQLEADITRMMECLDDLMTAVNAPEGVDDRATQDVFLYDATMTSQGQDELEDRTRLVSWTYEIPFRNDDGNGDNDD